MTYIKDERHVGEIELLLFLVELLQLSGVIVFRLLGGVRSHVSLLLGLFSESEHKRRHRKPENGHSIHGAEINPAPLLSFHLFYIRLGGIDVLIRLFRALHRTVCLSPFPLKALFTLENTEEEERKQR